MTYLDFLKHLRKLRRAWKLEPVNREFWIVSRQGGHSPLSAVGSAMTGKPYRSDTGRHRNPMFRGIEAAEDIGLTEEMAHEIENAAVGYGSYDLETRRDLLKACRLREARHQRHPARKARVATKKAAR